VTVVVTHIPTAIIQYYIVVSHACLVRGLSGGRSRDVIGKIAYDVSEQKSIGAVNTTIIASHDHSAQDSAAASSLQVKIGLSVHFTAFASIAHDCRRIL